MEIAHEKRASLLKSFQIWQKGQDGSDILRTKYWESLKLTPLRFFFMLDT